METSMVGMAILRFIGLAALSTGQTVGIVAGAWIVVIVVVATHEVVHRRMESNRQAKRLDTLETLHPKRGKGAEGDSAAG